MTPHHDDTRRKDYHPPGYFHEYYWKNREHIKSIMRMSARRNAEKRSVYHKKYMGERRSQILSLLGGKCVRCGFSDPRALQIDHVNGGGNKEANSVGKGYPYMKFVLDKIRNGSQDYQLLCANCNWIKKFEKGEHPPGRPKKGEVVV